MLQRRDYLLCANERNTHLCPLILLKKRDPLLETPGISGFGDPIKERPGPSRHHSQVSKTELVAVTVEREPEVLEMPVIKNSLQAVEEVVWAMKCN